MAKTIEDLIATLASNDSLMLALMQADSNESKAQLLEENGLGVFTREEIRAEIIKMLGKPSGGPIGTD